MARKNEELQACVSSAETRLLDQERDLREALRTVVVKDGELEAAKKSVDEWKKWDKGIRANLMEKEQELEDSTKLINDLQREADSLNATVMEKGDAIGKYKKKIIDLKEVLMDTTRIKEQAEQSLQKLQNSALSMEREIAELSAAKSDCDDRLAKKCLELDGALNRITVLQGDLSAALQDVAAAQAETAAQKQMHHSLEEAIRSSDNCLESLKGTCHSLRGELETSRQEEVKLAQTISQLRGEVNNRDAELEETKRLLRACQQDTTDTRIELTRMSEENAKAATEIEALRLAVNDTQLLRQQLTDAEHALTVQKDTISELRDIVDDLGEERACLQQSCKNDAILIENMTRDLENARGNVSTLEGLRSDLEVEVMSLRGSIDSLKVTCTLIYTSSILMES